jgi:PAP2 superfamily
MTTRNRSGRAGSNVNQLAAIPSLHFSYAFTIGCTLIYHSGVFKRRSEISPSRWKQLFFVALGICYPTLVLTVIVATANHYWLDAVAGFFVVLFAFLCNKVFLVLLPLEDLFLWCTRLEKPVPTTGENNGLKEKILGHVRKPSWYRGPDVV